ncbi:MAG: right-handed parallel beta-helix repeat-containing protein [Geobacter sp.]|nr:MAG: right-handed parallel beta-helix repeat-containing protein [Geobacter sp.]
MWNIGNIRLRNILLFLIVTLYATSAFAGDVCPETLPAVVRGDVTLPEGCVFEQSINIIDSNTSLNCNGSVFDGKGKDKIGLLIDSKGNPLTNIKVENCVFRNFKSSGIRISWSEVDARKGTDHEKIYSVSPNSIFLDKIIIEGSGGVGLYIDDYVTNVTVQNSVIQRSSGVGIYLEHSSKGNRIVNNKLLENGYRVGKGAREAIAVDSSAENLIDGNIFKNNAAGGIFLYKNCGERFSSGKQVIRWQHSSHNTIRNNLFQDEKVGIWLASRQSRNLSKWDCGDKPMDQAGKYFEDFADSNTIYNNLFCRTVVGIRVASDLNEITGNQFDQQTATDIDIPVTMREKLLHRPHIGNIITNNSKVNCRETEICKTMEQMNAKN